MVHLFPMTEEEYDAFMKVSRQGFIDDQVQAGHWRADEAEKNMQMLVGQMLPGGQATPDHFFFSIKDGDVGNNVGGLWFMLEKEDGNRQIFVMDIQVYPEHRRQGYGSQAFLAMEEQVREMGILMIVLHVFKHNHSARAMYEKLGYVGEDTRMVKKISME